MSVLDLAFKQMDLMSMLQEQFNSQIKPFLETTRTLEFYKGAEAYLGAGVGSCNKDPVYLER